MEFVRSAENFPPKSMADRLLFRILSGPKKLTSHQPPLADGEGFGQFSAFWPQRIVAKKPPKCFIKG